MTHNVNMSMFWSQSSWFYLGSPESQLGSRGCTVCREGGGLKGKTSGRATGEGSLSQLGQTCAVIVPPEPLMVDICLDDCSAHSIWNTAPACPPLWPVVATVSPCIIGKDWNAAPLMFIVICLCGMWMLTQKCSHLVKSSAVWPSWEKTVQ